MEHRGQVRLQLDVIARRHRPGFVAGDLRHEGNHTNHALQARAFRAKAVPEELEVHLVLDNYGRHKTALIPN